MEKPKPKPPSDKAKVLHENPIAKDPRHIKEHPINRTMPMWNLMVRLAKET